MVLLTVKAAIAGMAEAIAIAHTIVLVVTLQAPLVTERDRPRAIRAFQVVASSSTVPIGLPRRFVVGLQA
ncbi:MAG: hypothetical protein PW843_22305 [Azospirillaceae bacterium]|nr:hypothetical protein [Azospirillaceae bacterium]